MDENAPYLPHAPSSVNLLAVLDGAGIMVGGIALALLGAWLVSGLVPSPVSAPNNAERPKITDPVQRTAPSHELEAFLREKKARLHGRGVDRATGEAFIPIEEAMKSMAADRPGAAGRSR